MIYILFETINPVTRIEMFNLKYDIYKTTLSKFVYSVKDILYDMSSNYTIIVDKGRWHED